MEFAAMTETDHPCIHSVSQQDKSCQIWYTLYVVVSDVFFAIKTPLGTRIRTTKAYWKRIITLKHPSIAKYKNQVQETLKDPDQIRRSKQDLRVHLYYRNIGKVHVCVVADHVDQRQGYIITAYLTDRIKEGVKIYVKN